MDVEAEEENESDDEPDDPEEEEEDPEEEEWNDREFECKFESNSSSSSSSSEDSAVSNLNPLFDRYSTLNVRRDESSSNWNGQNDPSPSAKLSIPDAFASSLLVSSHVDSTPPSVPSVLVSRKSCVMSDFSVRSSVVSSVPCSSAGILSSSTCSTHAL